MTAEAYLDAVEAELKGLTRGEREDVRRELAAHLEDHRETLRGIGCTEEEADERATAAMGDPAAVGRDIAKLYRPFWLWLERMAAVLIALTAVWALLGVGAIGSAMSSVYARFCAPDDETVIRVDERMAVGDDVVRLYGVGGYAPGERCEVTLWLCAFDRVPFGFVDQNFWIWFGIYPREGRGEQLARAASDGWSNEGATYRRLTLPLEAGETGFTLRYERFGRIYERVIELPEVAK